LAGAAAFFTGALAAAAGFLAAAGFAAGTTFFGGIFN